MLPFADIFPGTLEAFDVAADCWRAVVLDQPILLNGARVLLLRGQRALTFPHSYVCDNADGLDACLNRNPGTPLQDAFRSAFPRSVWSRNKVLDAISIWRTTPIPVRAVFLAAGRSDDGRWDELAQQVPRRL